MAGNFKYELDMGEYGRDRLRIEVIVIGGLTTEDYVKVRENLIELEQIFGPYVNKLPKEGPEDADRDED